jgi:hypothetical protein
MVVLMVEEQEARSRELTDLSWPQIATSRILNFSRKNGADTVLVLALNQTISYVISYSSVQKSAG